MSPAEDSTKSTSQLASALVAQVRRTLLARGLLGSSRSVLVACSGGPDSQVLLHVLHALSAEQGLTLAVASVDHGLRPDAANDVQVARALAHELELPFHALSVSVPPGASRQALARDARYRALLDCARELGAQRVAVGHTLDDQAETVLERLLRGTGLDGLAAVAPTRADGVIRPLIDVRRSAVEAYARQHGVPFACDPSNEDTRYLRVRVRRALLPQLAAENPQISLHLAALADDARAARTVLFEAATHALERCGGFVTRLQEESPAVRRSALKLHVESATQTKLRRTHLVALERMLSEGGQVRLPGDHVATLDSDGRLSIERVAKRGRGAGRLPGEEPE
jgi:tRNA(Ile)-lysidine synthase